MSEEQKKASIKDLTSRRALLVATFSRRERVASRSAWTRAAIEEITDSMTDIQQCYRQRRGRMEIPQVFVGSC